MARKLANYRKPESWIDSKILDRLKETGILRKLVSKI